MKFSIPCIIFAGGKSSRMGEDKALLPFGEFSTLTEYQYHRLLPLFEKIYISTKSDKFPFKAPTIFDDETLGVYAPTAGLLTIFNQLKSNAFFAISVDTPFVDEKVIKKLIEVHEKENKDAVIAKSPNGIHPMCGIYTKNLLPKLKEMVKNNQHRLGYLLKTSNTDFVYFENDDPFFNLNHPEEYKLAIEKTK
ncbi:molybdenum cofactor guanylyltransferase MobA [Hydrogenimonas thermophila]|nr:molybdenum cofactor guanylyltransferase MobA [Hydrogenimonas thermophila]